MWTLQRTLQRTSRSARVGVRFSSDISDMASVVRKHALEPQTSTSLQTLMRTGRGEFLHKTYRDAAWKKDDKVATERVLMQVAGFLRHELPIRLAHRILDLEQVPLLRDMQSVRAVKDLYTTSFRDLLSVPQKVASKQEEAAFADIVESIYERHAGVLVQMARGAYELRAATRQRGETDFTEMEEPHAFLDRFYISRIGIRVLIGQYLSLRQQPVHNYIGIICQKTSPYEIVKRAIDDASFMCNRKYGDAPEVIITGRLDLTFPYVPTHLHYITLELLKNSMRATVDWHGVDADYPPIKVVIADGRENEDVVIKVSDEGGGIPRSNMNKIWSYLFTTADPAVQEGMVAFQEHDDHAVDSPLAGLGYGLPISRSYARYFGGDLSIMSMEGYGTDAFVYLTRLGNTREPLPI
uniref:Protein-serine/threonine kinase n=1 Tax=Ditylum brightwellii TaxID=49249 RepID=A0A7S4RJ49_9STRA